GGPVVREATRRGVLAAVVSLPLVATGCKGVGALGTPPRQQPDVTVVRDAIDGETLMISRYNAVLAAVPALAGSLGPLLQQHREHLARLRARLIEPDTASPPEHPPAVASSTAGSPVPGTPAAARAYLRHAEQAAAHLSGARQKAAAQDWQIHEASRDALAAMITALGAQPVAAAAAYRLPFRVNSGRAAVSLAAFLEDRVAIAYLGVVALGETRL